MAVASTATSVTYVGNGSTSTAYTIPFAFLDATHIQVLVAANASATPNVIGPSLYTVTRNSDGSGGSITTNPAVSSPARVTIKRVTPLTQPTTLPLAGALPSKSLETGLDRITMQVQEETVARAAVAADLAAVKADVAEISESLDLPVASTPTQKGILNTVYFAIRPDGVEGKGTATDPFDASTAVKFDTLMRAYRVIGSPVRFYLHQGTYKTYGRNPGSGTARGWWVWSGFQLIGIGEVTLTMDAWPTLDDGTPWIYKHFLIGGDETPGVYSHDVRIENITLDCNWQNLTGKQPGMQLLISNGTNVSNNNTVTIGASTYTFKTTLTPANGEVLIGANATASMLNLSRAINNSGGTPGTDYQVSAANASATSSASGTTLTITAKTGYNGPETNSVAVSKSATTLQWGLTGAVTRLSAPTVMAGAAVNGKNVTFENVRLKNFYGHRDSLAECFALKAAYTGPDAVANCLLRDCYVSEEWGDYGIFLNCAVFTSSGGAIENCTAVCRNINTTWNGIQVIGSDVRVSGNRTRYAAIGLYYEQSGLAENVCRKHIVCDNQFLRTTINGIFLHNPFFVDTAIWRDLVIINNIVELDDVVRASGGGGIVLGAYTNTDTSKSLHDVVILGNKIVAAPDFTSGSKSGISVVAVPGVTVESNTVDSRFTVSESILLLNSTNVHCANNRYSNRAVIPALADSIKPYCLLYSDQGFTLNHNSGAYVEAKYPFDSARINQGGMFNATTDKVTVPQTGAYRISAYISSENYEGAMYAVLAINGRNTGTSDFSLEWKADGYQVPVTADLWLTAGDELEIFVGHEATSTNVQFLGGSVANRSVWSVEQKS